MTGKFVDASRIAILAVMSLGAWGADFSFFATMRAGIPSANGPNFWELAAGSTAATTESRTHFQWDPNTNPSTWRPGDLPQRFEIAYNQSTGTGTVSVFDVNNAAFTASFTNAGAPLAAGAVWTLPTASFFATANATELSSVNIETMQFSPAVQILSGSLPSSLGASDTGAGPAVTNNIAAPIVFNSASNGGSWMISGTIRFSGIPPSGGVTGNQLLVGFGAFGSDSAIPESSSALLIGGGLIALGCLRHRRKSRPVERS